jgi:hypothetical protein
MLLGCVAIVHNLSIYLSSTFITAAKQVGAGRIAWIYNIIEVRTHNITNDHVFSLELAIAT